MFSCSTYSSGALPRLSRLLSLDFSSYPLSHISLPASLAFSPIFHLPCVVFVMKIGKCLVIWSNPQSRAHMQNCWLVNLKGMVAAVFSWWDAKHWRQHEQLQQLKVVLASFRRFFQSTLWISNRLLCAKFKSWGKFWEKLPGYGDQCDFQSVLYQGWSLECWNILVRLPTKSAAPHMNCNLTLPP